MTYTERHKSDAIEYNPSSNQNTMRLSDFTKDKLREAGVAGVYFFGSRASGNNYIFSDIDIGIVMSDIRNCVNVSQLYTQIYEIISADIPDSIGGPRLDISFLQKTNPVLAMKAIQYGKILFESNARFTADFEERTFRMYNDYLRLHREFQEATMKAFE
jgi:predicted nucleotidyltransferase